MDSGDSDIGPERVADKNLASKLEPTTVEDWEKFYLDFLKLLENCEADNKEIENISGLLRENRVNSNGRCQRVQGDSDFWDKLERAAKFLTRLHARGHLNGIDVEKKLDELRDHLLHPLHDRAQNRS